MHDKMEIEILEDGTLRVTTDSISGVNHMNAEKFLKWMADELGGTTERKSRSNKAHTHTHHHHEEQNN